MRLITKFAFLTLLVPGLISSTIATPSLAKDCKPGIGKNLTYCDYRKQNVRNAQFIGANLYGANFSGTDLTKTLFNGANLTKVNFSNAKLIDVEMGGLSSSGKNTAANLTKANFTGATLQRINFYPFTPINEANFTRARIIDLTMELCDLKNANFNGATLKNLRLLASDFTEAKFVKLVTSQISGDPILPKGWKLSKGKIVKR
jgi:uncharacterized protein YjbI with pentapeptide repeats